MTTFNITRQATTVVTTYEIADAPVLGQKWGNVSIAPTGAKCTQVNGKFQCLEIWGGRVKKDGTAGQNVSTVSFYNAGEVPDWALPLIGE